MNLLDVPIHPEPRPAPIEEGNFPSPFLPETKLQYAWDSTSLGWLKTCPRLYYYNMIEGWRSKNENIHLRFGIEFHSALQDYDVSRAEGIKHDDAVHDTVKALYQRTFDWNPEPEEGKRSQELKTKDALVRTVVWYLDEYENDPAKTYIMQNGKPAVEVSFRFELDWGPDTTRSFVNVIDKGGGASNITSLNMAQPYLISGHLDKVVEFGGDLFVMDRKTTTMTATPYYFAQFEPNNQMTLYTLASQIIFSTPVKGVIIDAAQLLKGSSRFVRSISYRTADQLEEWVEDLKFWVSQAENYANFNYWPMNDTACDKFGGCKFRGICSKSAHVRDRFLEAEFERGEKWNPLKPR